MLVRQQGGVVRRSRSISLFNPGSSGALWADEQAQAQRDTLAIGRYVCLIEGRAHRRAGRVTQQPLAECVLPYAAVVQRQLPQRNQIELCRCQIAVHQPHLGVAVRGGVKRILSE